MGYNVRRALFADLPRIEEIYAKARTFMETSGNPTQWGKSYPPREMLESDIQAGNLFVIGDENMVHGVFYFFIGEDPTYTKIYDGQWHSRERYGTIHRIAGDGSGGILRSAVNYGKKQCSYLRIDTHEDNKVMQRTLERQGFRRCGIIYIEDGSERIAYDRFDGVREAYREDLQDIMELYLHLHEVQIPDDRETMETVWNQIEADRNHHLLVYDMNGQIVSSCVCVIVPNLTRGMRPYAIIENVVTHPNYRGEGFGTACLQHAKEIAVNSGCYKMMLLTGAKDQKTLQFYSNAGYNSTDKTAFIQWFE